MLIRLFQGWPDTNGKVKIYTNFATSFHSFLNFLLLFGCSNHIQLFATPWTIACQASLSFASSQRLLKLTSFESVMLSNHLILTAPFSCPQSFPESRSLPMSHWQNRVCTLSIRMTKWEWFLLIIDLDPCWIQEKELPFLACDYILGKYAKISLPGDVKILASSRIYISLSSIGIQSNVFDFRSVYMFDKYKMFWVYFLKNF